MPTKKQTKSRGIVVDNKKSGVRYAVSPHRFNPKKHDKVRDLEPGETVLSFRPRRKSKTPAPQPSNTEAASPLTEGTK